MTWITMTTRIWLKKGFVRNLMKLQNIIETRIFTVHCLIKKIGIARQSVPENKISLQIIRWYSENVWLCIIMRKTMRCWVEEQTSLLKAWVAIQIFWILPQFFCELLFAAIFLWILLFAAFFASDIFSSIYISFRLHFLWTLFSPHFCEWYIFLHYFWPFPFPQTRLSEPVIEHDGNLSNPRNRAVSHWNRGAGDETSHRCSQSRKTKKASRKAEGEGRKSAKESKWANRARSKIRRSAKSCTERAAGGSPVLETELAFSRIDLIRLCCRLAENWWILQWVQPLPPRNSWKPPRGSPAAQKKTLSPTKICTDLRRLWRRLSFASVSTLQAPSMSRVSSFVGPLSSFQLDFRTSSEIC